MIVLSHPTVNAFNRALAEALHAAGRLQAFHTTLAWGRRRAAIPWSRIRVHPAREALRLAASRLGWSGLTRHESGFACVDAVYRSLDAAVARSLTGANAVYAYEDGALATFRAARDRGLTRCYELPIAYFETSQRLLREEAERLPAWAKTMDGVRDSEEKLARKAEEAKLANLVICPSRFVQRSLPEGARSIVAEFGSPSISTESVNAANRRKDGPLRLLFAGAMTQRKGLADVFAAMKMLQRRDVELVVMGSPVASMDFYRGEWPHFVYEPPRPRAQVLELMETCDALVLPSIVEGRALVQQEALSRGLPLLVTANAGGEDLVEQDSTGWLLPIRNPQAIAQRVAWLADNRAALPEMRNAAKRKAASITWADYTRKILTAIDGVVSGENRVGKTPREASTLAAP